MSGSKGLQVNMGEEIEKALIYSLTRDARADNVRLLNAALRRAKAEVWRKAAIEARIESVRKDETSGYQRASRCLADTYDARAAQIEEGE